MKRVLVFSNVDWLLPGASPVGDYLREVLPRVTAHGYQVSLVTVRPVRWSLPFWPGRRPGIEQSEGVQVLRLGWRPLYHFMAGMLLDRMARNGRLTEQFDVILECINGKPLMVARHLETVEGPTPPVLPLVFRLRRGMAADPDPPGPLLATSTEIRGRLIAMGVPERAIVTVPFGQRLAEGNAVEDTWDRTAALVLATLDNL